MSLGPVMLDLQGTTVTAEEMELLRHPQTGGVILFSRNYESPEQLRALTKVIHGLRDPHPIIAVDQEGGRVQRFKEGFTRLPAMSKLGELSQRGMEPAQNTANTLGWLMAIELLVHGIDISFAPVLDLSHGVSDVIGDRAFHKAPDIVAQLAQHIMLGMRSAGMAATGKHFPGHGGVKEDSHVASPIDKRPLNELLHADIVPFARLIRNGLAGIMPAHVVYSAVDDKPAGYSKIWVQEILRERLKFQGVVFSDDLSMEAAACGDSYAERAHNAINAGCDMVLVCNCPEAAAEVLHELAGYSNPVSQMRLVRMHGKTKYTAETLHQSAEWLEAKQIVEKLNE